MMVTLLLLLILLFVSCKASNDKYLEQCLILAGKNRIEFEKVLNHYKNDPLKIEAAKFLIRNMSDEISVFQTYVENNNASRIDSTNIDICKRKINIGESYFRQDSMKSDLENISAIFLIDNIDMAFKVWNSYSWCKKLPFSVFCNQILPYRLLSEPLTDWRQYYFYKHQKELDSLNALGASAKDVCFFINKKYQRKYIHAADILPISLTYSQLNEIGGGTCSHLAYLATLEMRACGVPLNYDIVVKHGKINGGHVYNSLDSCSDNDFIYFSPYERAPERSKWRSHQIIRICFADKEPEILKSFKYNYEVPEEILSSNSYPTVTDKYYPISNINIKIKSRNKEQILFLCTYNRGEFYAIAWSPIDNKTASFVKLTKELLYFPMFFIDGKFIAADAPFIIRENSNNQKIQLTMQYVTLKNLKLFAVKNDITKPNTDYSLYYWNKKWILFGKSKTDKNCFLSFDSVPKNTLYLLKGQGLDESIQRPFTNINDTIEYW
jgi:hypothetical protein